MKIFVFQTKERTAIQPFQKNRNSKAKRLSPLVKILDNAFVTNFIFLCISVHGIFQTRYGFTHIN